MIAILKYNAGNTRSVQNALRRLGADCIITDDQDKIRNADRVILPGVGAAAAAMEYLRMYELDKLIVGLSQPVLGICLGQQLMCKFSEEGDTQCLGIFDAAVKRFPTGDVVPHMGWNSIISCRGPLLSGLKKEDTVYFVHSYYAGICADTIATTNYILPFSAAMQKDNFYGTQFHPEKSADVGEKILQNFLTL